MLRLLTNPYTLIVYAGLIIGAFFFGRSTGIDSQQAKQARANAKAIAAMEKARDAIDVLSGRLADAQGQQQTETREIFRESVKIVERQSRAPCVDSGAVELFDRARANANRQLAGASTEPATGASGNAP